MDGYPPEYVALNVPLIAISGLGRGDTLSAYTASFPGLATRGIRLSSEAAEIKSEDAKTLLRLLQEYDSSNEGWSSREADSRSKLRLKAIGRDYTLPPPQAQSPDELTTGLSNSSSITLHSYLSPLTLGSAVFPDGLVHPQWIVKHQELVPSVLICFFKFTANPQLSSLHDNQLKSDINNIKGILNRSGYRTRLVLVLMSEVSNTLSNDIDERLSIIRRATSLDQKNSFFFLSPNLSIVELRAFVETLIVTIYPLSIEFYRDLTKHSRRKKNRGIIPPPTVPPTSGTSQTLSSQGWAVRYDFKLGVFAEIRQEMDNAIRSYESSYEGLLENDVFESIASWSPRWNEARMLSDIISIRVLRCLLWNGNTTAASRRWHSHRVRLRDIVDRRGKGSATYGWEAWEARWATIMAELIGKASFAEFAPPSLTVFIPPEKSIALGERMQPSDFLHHPGYWYREASKHLYARRILAHSMPEEDRNSPGASPASHIASRAYTYDTYLAPEPHQEYPLPGHSLVVNHSKLIRAALDNAVTEFEQRKQRRIAQSLLLQSARECLKDEEWAEALQKLRPVWQSRFLRKEGWWELVEELGWTLRTAAAHAGDGGTVLAVDWELMDKTFTRQLKWTYDLAKSLEGLEAVKSKPVVVINEREIQSFLLATYAFEKAEGKVGEYCISQFAITSCAHLDSAPLTFSEIVITFEGSMRRIHLQHKPDPELDAFHSSNVVFSNVLLTESETSDVLSASWQPTLYGCDQLIFTPGQTRIFQFSSPLREAGETRATSARFSLSSEAFDLDYVLSFSESPRPDSWWSNKGNKKMLPRPESRRLNVLPKPPKIDVQFANLKSQYYTDEDICLELVITNGEEEDATVALVINLSGENAPSFTLEFSDTGKLIEDSGTTEGSTEVRLGKLGSKNSYAIRCRLPAIAYASIHKLSIEVSYSLVSDPKTPILRLSTVDIPIICPFEASYDFSPRLQSASWPSFFSHDIMKPADESEKQADGLGLEQRWRLIARYGSFARDPLTVLDTSLNILALHGDISCNIAKENRIFGVDEDSHLLQIQPNTIEEAQFDVSLQKLSLDDRRSASLDLSLSMKWQRLDDASAARTTILPIQRLLVFSSEPRVLASASYSTIVPSLIHLSYTLENPSMHLLTFGLTMELNDEFAFSGIKQSTVQLLPLSKHTVKIRLLPNVRGKFIEPRLVVKDRYFQKVLKVLPTDSIKSSKEGILVWVPPNDDDDAESDLEDT